jgi:hypothetical protein
MMIKPVKDYDIINPYAIISKHTKYLLKTIAISLIAIYIIIPYKLLLLLLLERYTISTPRQESCVCIRALVQYII